MANQMAKQEGHLDGEREKRKIERERPN